MFCFFIHYVVYKDNGIGAPGLKGLGESKFNSKDSIGMIVLILQSSHEHGLPISLYSYVIITC